MSVEKRERVLFVTGKLAEPALRRVLADIHSKLSFECEVAVLPITVAALMTTKWIARHLKLSEDIDRIMIPGLCRGELEVISTETNRQVIRGPVDLRDLPGFLGHQGSTQSNYGQHNIEIIAEINHAPRLSHDEILAIAERHRQHGADVIDLGCDPGGTWSDIGMVIRILRENQYRVSVDSFNPIEVEHAIEAGAELVLSVNESNVEQVRHWKNLTEQFEVVAIPNSPEDLESLRRIMTRLREWSIPFRIDPILEPIGFGFAASLGRYLAMRQEFPDVEMMMGVGNLTELTDADSVGINVLLAGFCQELGIRSILTTEVINWCQSAVQEFALARRLVYHAVSERVLPKRLEPNLVLLRDPKLHVYGDDYLRELAERITDRNYRIFAERGEIHILNSEIYLRGTDPYELFSKLEKVDSKLDRSHSFYLGYEMAKAVTALTLGKNYEQDRALRWGFLTIPEVSHRQSNRGEL